MGAFSSHSTSTIRTSYPAQSPYSLDADIETASGTRTTLAELGGTPRIASMFYGHCASMCPVTLRTLQQLDASLSTAERSRLSFLLLSLDPSRDSVEVLKQYADAAHLRSDRWTLGRSATDQVPRIAERLGVRYRAIAGGEIDHGSELVLLDAQGRTVARSNGLGVVDDAFMSAVHALLADGPAQ
jgi:protein SCO1